MALTQIKGYPQSIKVSDRVLAESFRLAGLREYLGTRVTRDDLANASESLLVEAYLKGNITIEESVRTICGNTAGPEAGLSDLIKLAAERIAPARSR